jgi:hypothetical protein
LEERRLLVVRLAHRLAHSGHRKAPGAALVGGEMPAKAANRNDPPGRAVPGVLQGGEICVLLCLWEVGG